MFLSVYLQAMGLWTHTLAACDPKLLCQAWALGARTTLFSRTAHDFHDLSALKARRGVCLFRQGRSQTCRVRTLTVADLIIIGMPCQPFSMQCGDRGAMAAQAHPTFSMMLELLEYTKATKVHGGIVEEVTGFGHEITPSNFVATTLIPHKPRSWASYSIGRLRDQGYFVGVFKLCNSWFSDVPRPRTDRCLTCLLLFVRMCSMCVCVCVLCIVEY